jgi:hypothetical protein
MSRVPLYAVYGSYLDPGRMAEQAPRSPLWSTGWLEGRRLTFAPAGRPASDPASDPGLVGGVLPTLAEDPGSSVFVAVYDVHEWDEPNIAAWENTEPGVYTRARVRVHTLFEGAPPAWTYILDTPEGGLPTPAQLTTLATAAQKAGAPDAYLTDLLTRPSL